MPKYQETIISQVTDTDTNLCYAYQSFKQLGWNVLYAGPDKLLGNSTGTWKSNEQQILITATAQQITICSEMIHNESWDIRKKNKKMYRLLKRNLNPLYNKQTFPY
jgi:hypothetical protein